MSGLKAETPDLEITITHMCADGNKTSTEQPGNVFLKILTWSLPPISESFLDSAKASSELKPTIDPFSHTEHMGEDFAKSAHSTKETVHLSIP